MWLLITWTILKKIKKFAVKHGEKIVIDEPVDRFMVELAVQEQGYYRFLDGTNIAFNQTINNIKLSDWYIDVANFYFKKMKTITHKNGYHKAKEQITFTVNGSDAFDLIRNVFDEFISKHYDIQYDFDFISKHLPNLQRFLYGGGKIKLNFKNDRSDIEGNIINLQHFYELIILNNKLFDEIKNNKNAFVVNYKGKLYKRDDEIPGDAQLKDMTIEFASDKTLSKFNDFFKSIEKVDGRLPMINFDFTKRFINYLFPKLDEPLKKTTYSNTYFEYVEELINYFNTNIIKFKSQNDWINSLEEKLSKDAKSIKFKFIEYEKCISSELATFFSKYMEGFDSVISKEFIEDFINFVGDQVVILNQKNGDEKNYYHKIWNRFKNETMEINDYGKEDDYFSDQYTKNFLIPNDRKFTTEQKMAISSWLPPKMNVIEFRKNNRNEIDWTFHVQLIKILIAIETGRLKIKH